MGSKIDLLVVDDSLFMRSFLTKVLSSDPNIGHIKTAVDGASALSILNTYEPDVITLDVEMPRMNGLETLKILQQRYKIPVIMVSALTRKGADITIKCLELGAVDWLQKPENSLDKQGYEALKHDLLKKIKMVSRKGTVIKDGGIATQKQTTDRDNITNETFKTMVKEKGWMPSGKVRLDYHLIAIGVSTGGPSALNQVVPFLPEDINAAAIIVQHMPSTFTKVLSERLNEISKIKVKEADDNETVQRGVVYIVPGDKHIRLVDDGPRQLRIILDDYPKLGGFKPSAEELFYFTAEAARDKAVGIIMTGMGSDGSENLGLIKAYSGNTIAQDESTCVIFGMPKVAIQNGHVNYVLPLNKIIDKIKEIVQY